ncbi:hypothetical protein K439DRAFT_1615337 [Ramaria rubella]|nr:hypothetical protein K439DRAFT_1615337 [Ramaria rubella]
MPSKSGCKGPMLTYRQRQLARQTALLNRCAINADVDDILDYMEERAKQLSVKHKRSLVWFFHQFYQGGCVVCQKCAVSVFNAACQIEGFLEGHKGETFLERKAEAWHAQKQTAPCANLSTVIQDSRLTLDRVAGELMALSQCTGVETILFAVKGKSEHSLPGFVATSEKGNNFLLHGMKTHTSDIVKEFESYVLSNVNGLTLNHNGRLTELRSKIRIKIREGLVSITGDAKATMQYDCYKKLIMAEKGVELINWPDEIPFVNASEIGSMITLWRLFTALTLDNVENQCRWVKLSEEEWDKRREAYYEVEAAKGPRKRKRKQVEVEEGSDSSSSSSSDAKGSNPAPAKKSCKTTGKAGKENVPTGANVKKKDATKGKGKAADKAKPSGKKRSGSRSKKAKDTAAVSGNVQETAGANSNVQDTRPLAPGTANRDGCTHGVKCP